MAINFPTSPSTNDTFTAGSITYKWDGAKWIGLGVTPTDRLIEGSNKLEIDGSNNLVWTGDNVGVGTDNPGEKLVVQGPVVCKGTLSAGQTSAGVLDFSGNDLRIRCYGATTGSGALSIRTGGGAGNADTERLLIDASGNVTLGYAGNSLYFQNGFNNRASRIQNGGGSGSADLKFFTNDAGTEAERLRITSDGQLQATGAADVRLTLGSGGTAGTNNSVHMRADGANLLFMNASGGLTKFESNGTETLSISSGGYVTKPANPAFIVRYSVNDTTWNVATDGWTKIPFDEENMDRGGNFNTSTSEFTAPVAGTYLFGAELQLEAPNGISSGYITSGSFWMYITFIVNGASSLVESEGGTRTDANFSSMYNSHTPTHLLNLDAGDTVCMYRTGNYTSIKFKGGGESVFWGYLVG